MLFPHLVHFLRAKLPVALGARVEWVNPDLGSGYEIAFNTNDSGLLWDPRTVRVPKELWLTDEGIAKICLEAP